LKQAITEFFTKYNEAQGKRFRAIQFASPQRAIQLTREAMESAERSGSQKQNGNQTR
jgi:hypothetical protein